MDEWNSDMNWSPIKTKTEVNRARTLSHQWSQVRNVSVSSPSRQPTKSNPNTFAWSSSRGQKNACFVDTHHLFRTFKLPWKNPPGTRGALPCNPPGLISGGRNQNHLHHRFLGSSSTSSTLGFLVVLLVKTPKWSPRWSYKKTAGSNQKPTVFVVEKTIKPCSHGTNCKVITSGTGMLGIEGIMKPMALGEVGI